MKAESRKTRGAGALPARIAALALALLMAAAYLVFTTEEQPISIRFVGRDKAEIPTGEALTWSWEPESDHVSELSLTLSGKKKAAGMTVTAALTGPDGAEAASVRQPIDELGDSDSLTLTGSFSPGTVYTLSLRAEGEGTIKVKGEEDESGAFMPTLQETGFLRKRNAALLFFACGLLLLALTPVFPARGVSRPVREKAPFSVMDLLPWAAFLLILGIGVTVSLRKPTFEELSLWRGWDEEIHRDIVRAMTPHGAGSLQNWSVSLLSWAPGYLPLALGESLAGLFTQDPQVLYRAAVLMSSLVYALMAGLAVRRAPRYKLAFLAAATIPATMFQMPALTYDTVVTSSILLGLALVLESADRQAPVTPLRALTMTALLAFGTVAKPAYSVALLALLMIPADRLGGRKKAWLFRGFVLLFTVWCMVSVALPGAYDNVRAGDERYAGTSASGQIASMLASPGDLLLYPIREFWADQNYLMNMGLSQWAFLGNSGGLIELYLVLMLMIAPLCAFEKPGQPDRLLTPGRRIGFAAVAFGAELILAYTQYIVSNPVGSRSLEGMQPRYFIPVWISLLLAVMAPWAVRKRIDARAGAVLAWAAFALCAWANISFALGWLALPVNPV